MLLINIRFPISFLVPVFFVHLSQQSLISPFGRYSGTRICGTPFLEAARNFCSGITVHDSDSRSQSHYSKSRVYGNSGFMNRGKRSVPNDLSNTCCTRGCTSQDILPHCHNGVFVLNYLYTPTTSKMPTPNTRMTTITPESHGKSESTEGPTISTMKVNSPPPEIIKACMDIIHFARKNPDIA